MKRMPQQRCKIRSETTNFNDGVLSYLGISNKSAAKTNFSVSMKELLEKEA